MQLRPVPPTFAATRDALHTVAERVLAPARHRVTGRIGLIATPNGFGTPVFGDGEQVRVEGVELVLERAGATTRRALTTIADAAEFVGVDLAAPMDVYELKRPLDPDAPLGIDAAAAGVLADWYGFGTAALDGVRRGRADASSVQLWPEHFDLGCEFGDEAAGGRATYGASPGDEAIAEPYLYVGPWVPERRHGALAAYPFGAAITYLELVGSGTPDDAAGSFLARMATLLAEGNVA